VLAFCVCIRVFVFAFDVVLFGVLLEFVNCLLVDCESVSLVPCLDWYWF